MTRDHRRLAAIVSADVVGYSLLMGRDDSATLAGLKSHRRELIDPKIAEYAGRIVKATGDGLLLEFASVVDAVRCAVDVQRGMAERNAGVLPEQRIEFRIGINVGDIIIDDDDIFGDGVNVAARLQTLAEPGGICVSRVVRDHVLDKLSFVFDDLGAQEVKNIVRPIEVYRVALDSGTSTPEARRRLQHLTQTAGRPLRPARMLLAAAVALGLTLAAWTATRLFHGPEAAAPYSIEDRRMTFAVLPFSAPTDDKEAAQVATAMTDATFAAQESSKRWAQVAARGSVERAVTRLTGAKQLASDLNVHFLLRGNVTRVASGYNVELLVIDGATERVIDTQSLPVATGTLVTRRAEQLESALGSLTYKALEVEVQRARNKPADTLDVRDLSFRAYVDWNNKKIQKDEKGAYITAEDLLNRALTLAPDDALALMLTAEVNLCDCVQGWSRNVEEQQAIGARALEKYLRQDPTSPAMLSLKAELYQFQGRYEEAVLIADSLLQRDPDYISALSSKAYSLLKLGKPKEALTALNLVSARRDLYWPETALAAAIHYEFEQYELAAQMAQKATTQMTHEQLINPRMGAVRLTLVAAEAQLGHLPRARRALADFNSDVPGVQTIPAMKKWIHQTAELADYEPLFAGLRRAGVSD